MSWKNWCRLCGNMNEIEIVVEIFIKNENLCTSLSETIQRFFAIIISDYDEAPKKICIVCQEFINKIEDFSLKATRMQEMYSELEFNDTFEMYTNFDQIRAKYAYDNENKFGIFEEEKISSDKDASSDDDIPLAQRRKKINRFEKVTIENEEERTYEISEKKSNLLNENNEFNYDNAQGTFDCNSAEVSAIITAKFNRNKIQKCEIKKNIKEPTVFCEICNRGFVNEGGYKTHFRIAHKIIKKIKSFPCEICGKVYTQSANLKIHQNTHLPPDERKFYPCPHCDKMFTTEKYVAVHIRFVHIKEKYFVCDECGKAFTTLAALAGHKVVHTDDKPFQCSKCSKSFKSSFSLRIHVDTHDDTKYICRICGAQLNTKQILRQHMMVRHFNEKKYKCNFCDKDFKSPQIFKYHLILHTGLKPYQCPFCEQTFANGSNCRKHQKTTHPRELAEKSGTIPITNNIPRPSMQLLKAINESAISNNKNFKKKIQ